MSADAHYQGGDAFSARDALTALDDIAKLAHLVERAVSARLPKPVTVAQYTVLKLLSEAQAPQTITTLARTLEVSQPTMSSTVAKLQQRGLVAALAVPHDRRARKIELTEKGLTLKRTCDTHVEPMLETALAPLPEENWSSLQSITAAIAEQFTIALSPDGKASSRM